MHSCHITGQRAALVAALLLVCASPALAQAPPPSSHEPAPTLFGRPVARGGLHFMVAFGWGGGPTSNGLLHSMELGHTFINGLTLAYNHVFVWSDGLGKPRLEPGQTTDTSDLFGGHFAVLKVPIIFDELVAKFGAGLGENVDLSDGFKAFFGFGWTYGVDIHLPLLRTSGLTLTLLGVHAVTSDRGHQVAFAAGLGYSWF